MSKNMKDRLLDAFVKDGNEENPLIKKEISDLVDDASQNKLEHIRTLKSQNLLNEIVQDISREEVDGMIITDKNIHSFEDIHNYLKQENKDLFYIKIDGYFKLMNKRAFNFGLNEEKIILIKVLDQNEVGDYEKIIRNNLK